MAQAGELAGSVRWRPGGVGVQCFTPPGLYRPLHKAKTIWGLARHSFSDHTGSERVPFFRCGGLHMLCTILHPRQFLCFFL